ncbi:hypothetical protein B0O99DRAFT_657316 [Bisporella sp. PMI_857]|nr:hypothetical protein B0O99DRAFT_657316 [Bisporella sp. PMI_857]
MLRVSQHSRFATQFPSPNSLLDIADSVKPQPAAMLLDFKAKADQVRECQRCRSYFTQAFQIPKLWWTASCRNSNGYFGCEDTIDGQGNMTGLNTWARFMVKHLKEDNINYDWYKLNVFTRWLSSSSQTILLVFDAPPLIAERLPSLFLDEIDVENFGDPFWIYTLLVEEVVRLQDQAVWAVRNQVRAMENERTPATKPKPNYRHLHNIGRHAIHVSETLDIAVKTMDSILTQHKDFTTGMFHVDKKSIHTSKQIRNRLLFHQHMLTSLRHRSASNKQRLLNEIQLSFNTVAQYDSGISVEIGRAAQVDSAAMKTIAFLTLAFLPATFVSAIFSMSFFNYNADTGSWAVSDKFWVYWAVAVPTTIVTSLSWYYWQKALPPISIGEDKIDEASGLHVRQTMKGPAGSIGDEGLRT